MIIFVNILNTHYVIKTNCEKIRFPLLYAIGSGEIATIGWLTRVETIESTSSPFVVFERPGYRFFQRRQNGLDSIDCLTGKDFASKPFLRDLRELRGEFGFGFIETNLEPFQPRRTRRSGRKANRFLSLPFIVRIVAGGAKTVQPDLPSSFFFASDQIHSDEARQLPYH